MLSARDRAVLDAMLPSQAHPALPLGAFDAGFEEFHGGFEAGAEKRLRIAFRAALWVAAWISPLLIGRLPPFDRLAPEDRERALSALCASRSYLLRQFGLVLKAVLCFCYAAHPRVREAIGYPRQFDHERWTNRIP